MASAATIHYRPTISALRPKAECKCDGPDALVLNNRIERVGRRNVINCDAMLCMACGTIKPVAAEFVHYHHALGHFWAEHGWHRGIGMKLVELADLSTGNDFESFMALRSGMSPADCAAYLAGRGECAPVEA